MLNRWNFLKTGFYEGIKIVLEVIRSRDRRTLHDYIDQVNAYERGAYFIHEWAPYDDVVNHNTGHETVNQSMDEWVRGDVQTKTTESVWRLLKRTIIGAYHRVSLKDLRAYLDELEWRLNNRDNPWLFRDTLLKLLNSENLPYQGLKA